MKKFAAVLAVLALVGEGAPALAAADLTSWSGVWTRAPGHGASFDPAAPRRMAPYKADWLAAFSRLPKAEVARTTPSDGNCLPEGMPAMMNLRERLEFVPQAKSLVAIGEYKGAVRRIFMDGRAHPEDMWATFNGHSIGRWEGDVLVIDTIRLRTDVPFAGAFTSDDMKIVERMRLLDANTLENQITVSDPKAFTAQWTVTKIYRRAPGARIKEQVCKG